MPKGFVKLSCSYMIKNSLENHYSERILLPILSNHSELQCSDAIAHAHANNVTSNSSPLAHEKLIRRAVFFIEDLFFLCDACTWSL